MKLSREAELSQLRQQLQPHFLFNSLNSIVSLIASDPDKAEQSVLDLSDLFRANLGSADSLATWAEERRLCEGYLRIEQYRLGDRMRVIWHVASLPDATPMPLLTLQPLLENAILHGLQPRLDGGEIVITAEYADQQVELMVRNTCPEETGNHQGARMAMENIRARLQTLFGEEAKVELWREGSCFFSRLVYPCRQTSSLQQRSH